MASKTITSHHDAQQVRLLLDSPEIASLITQLESLHWTGRPGYPIRAIVGLALVKSLHTAADLDAHRRPGQ